MITTRAVLIADNAAKGLAARAASVANYQAGLKTWWPGFGAA